MPHTLFRRCWALPVGWLLCSWALAQPANERVLKIVVPFGPGGGSDFLARLIAPRLSEVLKETVVIDNRPGAGGTVGTDFVAKSAPDGQTVLLADSGAYSISPSLYPKLSYAAKDLAPVINLAIFGNVLVAHPKLAANNMSELLVLEKAQPGKLSMGSSGNGASPHLTGELFKTATGIRLTHVPYKGSGPAINDLVSGHIDVMFTGYATVSGLIKSGRLKPLAVTSAQRLPSLPETGTVAEAGFAGFSSFISQGVFAPAATPRERVQRLNREIAGVLRHPEVLEKMRQASLEPHDNTPEQFSAWLQTQSQQWARVIREGGITPD
jgi:tripartite-type tricarboxylate transporter receptor subunit TctC